MRYKNIILNVHLVAFFFAFKKTKCYAHAKGINNTFKKIKCYAHAKGINNSFKEIAEGRQQQKKDTVPVGYLFFASLRETAERQ